MTKVEIASLEDPTLTAEKPKPKPLDSDDQESANPQSETGVQTKPSDAKKAVPRSTPPSDSPDSTDEDSTDEDSTDGTEPAAETE